MSSKLIKRGAVPELDLEDPTGQPSWPLVLLSGVEGSGKSYLSAAASASELIGRTFYLPIGETGIDEYGAIPGARFQKLRHDGTFTAIARQAWAATTQPRTGGKPNLIVVDSATELWDLVTGEQQEVVNAKAAQRGRGKPGEDAEMGFDNWNAAKKRWRAFIDLLREHDGPVVFTARLEEVADAPAILAGNKGAPKIWKPRVEKNLPYDVDAVFQARSPRVWLCTKVRSLNLTVEPGEELRMPDREFTLDWFWRKLGLDQQSAQRSYVAPDAEAHLAEHAREVAETYAQQGRREAEAGQEVNEQRARARARKPEEWAAEIGGLTTVEAARELWAQMNRAGLLMVDVDGVDLQDRLRSQVEKIEAAAKGPAAPAAARVPASVPAPGSPAMLLAASPVADDPGECRLSAARRGVLASLETLGVTPEDLIARFGRPLEQIASKRLTALVRQIISEHRADAPPPVSLPNRGGHPEAPEGSYDEDGSMEAPLEPDEVLDAPGAHRLTEPDAADLRRMTPQRRAVLSQLIEVLGAREAMEAVCEQEFGFGPDEVGTSRLREWLTREQRANATHAA